MPWDEVRSSVTPYNLFFSPVVPQSLINEALTGIESLREGERQEAILIKIAKIDLKMDNAGVIPRSFAEGTYGLKLLRGKSTFLEGERYVLRQKIVNPTNQHINDALEKFLHKTSINKQANTIQEMTAIERDYEVKMKKHRRFW